MNEPVYNNIYACIDLSKTIISDDNKINDG